MENDIAQLVLSELKTMNQHMSNLDTRIGNIETRLDNIETRLDNIEANVSEIREQQKADSESIDFIFILVKELRDELRDDLYALSIITRDNSYDIAKLKAAILPEYDAHKKTDEIIEKLTKLREKRKLIAIE